MEVGTQVLSPPLRRSCRTAGVRMSVVAAMLLLASACGGGFSSSELAELQDEAAGVRRQVVELQDQVGELHTQSTVLVANSPIAERSTTVVPVSALAEEHLVLAAIAEFMPEGRSCEEQFLSADSPERGWEGWGGYGWETEIDTFEESIVQITCDFDSQMYWFRHQLRIQYPLKTGEAAEVINSLVRSEVAKGVVDYFNDSRGRFSELMLTDEEQRSDQKQHRGCGYAGYLNVSGVVTYSKDGLHSVYVSFSQNHPCANTTDNPVVSMNFDEYSENGRERVLFGLPDLFKDGSDWKEAIWAIVIQRREDAGRPVENMEPMSSYVLATIDFNLGPEALSLHAQPYTTPYFPGWCCGAGSAHLDIPYEELADYLDPDGPYRVILNN